MSRVGKQPIKLPANVAVTVSDGRIRVEGPRGKLESPELLGTSVTVKEDGIVVGRESDDKPVKAKHGLMRALINNMVVGVSQGYEKKLEVNGVGFRVNLSGDNLRMTLGFSHELVYKIPTGIEVSVEQNIITIRGIDKQQVGQVAAEIRALKKPEPYKGKGIKYVDEQIIRKSGKSGKEG